MALLVDYSQTQYGIPYNDAYIRVVSITLGKPAKKDDGTLADAFINVAYHTYASQDAADAGADALYVGHESIPFAIDDTVSFASVYEALKLLFENPRDV